MQLFTIHVHDRIRQNAYFKSVFKIRTIRLVHILRQTLLISLREQFRRVRTQMVSCILQCTQAMT